MAPSETTHTHAFNQTQPLKIVLLGAPSVGKSTFANHLQSHYFRETYYPTRKPTKILFDFVPQTIQSKSLMDEYGGLQAKALISNDLDTDIVFSPVVFQSYNRSLSGTASENVKKGSKKIMLKNDLYGYLYKDLQCPLPHYHAPQYTPVSVEIIDTPAFRKDMVVPFLEVSLFRNLDKEDLHGLADEPRRPVSTNPLLVASGSGELDGRVDGYVFMYSAVPSSNPPSYDDVISPMFSPATTTETSAAESAEEPDSLAVLEIIRTALYDAWREYRSYQRKWKKGAEKDIYSLVYGLKQLWKMKSSEEQQRQLSELRSYSSKLDQVNWDPSDPLAPPPIIIVCSHTAHPAASPLLIDAGRRLAGLWRCGFVSCDSETGQGVQEVMALMVRECVERKKIQGKNHQTNGSTRGKR